MNRHSVRCAISQSHGDLATAAALVTSYGLHVTKFRLMAKSEIPLCLTAAAALPRGRLRQQRRRPSLQAASNSLPAQLPWPPAAAADLLARRRTESIFKLRTNRVPLARCGFPVVCGSLSCLLAGDSICNMRFSD